MKPESDKPKPSPARRKLGDEAHDQAVKPRKIDPDFRQSTDNSEDRGSILAHLAGRRGIPDGKRKSR
jgi:hypothetical protein